MIPTADAAMMTAIVTASLDTPVTIKRRTSTPDSWGSSTETWSTVKTTMCTLARPSGGTLQAYADLLGALITWAVRLPAGTDVQRNDHLIIGSLVLEVQVDLDPQSYSYSTKVLASEVR